MTTERYHRCTHCGEEYIYQGSGPHPPPFNHHEWCHGCAQAVAEALQARPRLYECRYQDTDLTSQYRELTLMTVLAWEEANANEAEVGHTTLLPQFRRVLSPLFDMKSGDTLSTREIVGRDEHRGVKFRLATWRDKPGYTLTAPMEVDLLKGIFTGRRWPH